MTESTPLASIIMPPYNKRPYVARAIDSVMKQTCRGWELIIVDDGSTDGSADVVPRGDPRIKLLRQDNMGPAAARNAAVREAAGEYLAFIDADDCYYPFKLEHEMGLLWKGRKAEWMMSAYDYRLNGRTTRHYMKDIKGMAIDRETVVVGDALSQLTVAGWPSDGLFMKKTLFERLAPGFNEKMRYGEITELILRCSVTEPRVLICHVPLYLHIDVPGSTAKVGLYKDEYLRQMGGSLYELGKKHHGYAGFLMGRSRASMISYCASLVLAGRHTEARRFLREEFPFGRDMRYWKMWAATWLPARLLAPLARTARGRR